MKNLFSKTHILALSAALASLGTLSYVEYNYSHLKNQTSELELTVSTLKQELSEAYSQNNSLNSANTAFKDQISGISSTLTTLAKISSTDSELLQKYSKIYFLNENYVPSPLANIDSAYLFSSSSKKTQIHAKILPHLKDMLDSAKAAGTPIKIISAYRSFGEQAAVKTGYKILYGSGANRFSADQGYSEHQLGTTIDVVSASSTGTLTTSFEKTNAYDWLAKNAYRYGFVLSYPKNNAYYQFEPWHWRFVGIDLAKKLHDQGKYFYEMDQREINTYLANFFD